jgi:hypothetical protein
VSATGYITVPASGKLAILLLGRANTPLADAPPLDPTQWTTLGTSGPLAIAGPTSQWYVQGVRMMFYFGSGKLHGEIIFRIGDNAPLPSVDLTPITGLMKGIDPSFYLAVGASFTPNSVTPPPPPSTVQLAHFQIGSEI